MSKRLVFSLASALATLLLIAPAASAEEIGNACIGNDTEPGATMIGLSNQGSQPYVLHPQVPPEGNFVITRWRVQVGPGIGPLAQQLIASRQVGEEDDVKVGESAVETLVPGTNQFATRIPVPEYAHVGLRGPEQTLVCDQELNTTGRVKGDWPVGEQRHFEVLTGVGVPVIVKAERDRDGDGYGDETQDRCPASAAFQTSCPALGLTTLHNVKRGAVLVHVTMASHSATAVWGQVGWWGKRPGGGKRRVLVNLSAGPRQPVSAGITTTFRLPLSKSILRRLRQLPPKRSLRANLTVSVNDIYGAGSEQPLTVRLRGRG